MELLPNENLSLLLAQNARMENKWTQQTIKSENYLLKIPYEISKKKQSRKRCEEFPWTMAALTIRQKTCEPTKALLDATPLLTSSLDSLGRLLKEGLKWYACKRVVCPC